MGLFDKMNLFKRKVSDENNIISREVKVKDENLSEEVYPLAYSVGYLKNRTTDLVREETGTAERIKGIEESFIEVRDKAGEISTFITNFAGRFNEMENFSDEFNNKIINILKSVQNAHSKVSSLRDSSKLAEDSFEVVGSIFENFEKSYMLVKEYTAEITDISDKINGLVLNASAEVREEGKGNTVLAEDVTELTEKIKKLGKAVTVSMGDIEGDSNQLNVFLKHFKKTIDKSYGQVGDTEEAFANIKTNIYGVSKTNEMISIILNESNMEVKNIRENIKESSQYYDRVTEDIENLNSQMTNKGIIFEDIANFLDQMDCLLDDIDNKR